MANTSKLGFNWRGLAWGDGEPITRLTLPDGTIAESQVALLYAWNGSAFVRVSADASNNLNVNMAGASAPTILYASIDTAVSGDNTIVSAVAAKTIVVVSYMLGVSAAVSVRWKSGAATNLSGAVAYAANGGAAMANPPSAPLFATGVNTALVLNLSGATQTSGHLSYYTL